VLYFEGLLFYGFQVCMKSLLHKKSYMADIESLCVCL